MPIRRRALLTATVAASAATAGCLDLLFGDGLEIEATAASVSQSALEATGYEEHQVTSQTIEREFEVQGETRSVSATNKHAEYDRAIDLSAVGVGNQRAATFSAFTTPKAEIAGESLNPIEDMNEADVVQRAQARYDGFGNLSQVGESSVTLLGESGTTATEFEGEAALSGTGQTVDLTLHITEEVGSGDDFALAIAAYPTRLDSIERENVFTLIEGVQHDG